MPDEPIFETVFYQNSGGNEPMREFLRALPRPARLKCGSYMNELEWQGLALKASYLRKIAGDIWELRPEFGGIKYRLYFGIAGNQAVYVHVIVKKQQKAERSDGSTSGRRHTMTHTSALDDLLAEDLADPEGRALYEEIGAMVAFGVALSIARAQRRLSLKTLAARTEISQPELRDIEMGNIAPTLVMQQKIAHALNARIEIGANGWITFMLLPQPVQRRESTRLNAGARALAKQTA